MPIERKPRKRTPKPKLELLTNGRYCYVHLHQCISCDTRLGEKTGRRMRAIGMHLHVGNLCLTCEHEFARSIQGEGRVLKSIKARVKAWEAAR